MRSILVACLVALGGCRQAAVADRAPSPLPAATSTTSIVAVRMDSVAVQYVPDDRSFVARSPQGAVQWRMQLPKGDELVGVPCVAPDSTVYARGRKGLYALSPSGELSWHFDAPAFGSDPFLASPAALKNSGVVLVVDPWTVVALAPDGDRMWQHRLEKSRFLRSGPAIGPDGFVTLVTSESVLQLSGDGAVMWERLAEPVAPRP